MSIPGPKVIKLFSRSTQLSMKISQLINMKIMFICRENFKLSWAEQEKSFKTSGPVSMKQEIYLNHAKKRPVFRTSEHLRSRSVIKPYSLIRDLAVF